MKIDTPEGRTIDTSKILLIKIFPVFDSKCKKKIGVWCLFENKSVIPVAMFDSFQDAQNYKKYLEGVI